jgi:hypothetical protein
MAILAFIVIYSGTAFYMFTLAAVFIGILYPRLFQPLAKEAADLLYYCIAIIGVSVLFSTQESERKNLQVTAEIEHFETMHKYIDELNKNINNKLVQAGYPYFEDELKYSIKLAIQTKMHFFNCNKVLNKNCSEGVKHVLIARNLLSSPDFRLELNKYTQEEIKGAVHFTTIMLPVDKEFQGDMSIRSIDAINLFYSATEDKGVLAIKKHITSLESLYKGFITDSKKRFEENMPSTSDVFDKILFSYIWAYILSIALSLKLARHTLFTKQTT